MVAVVALAWKTDAMVPAARVRLNAIAAMTSQAALAAKWLDGKCARAPPLKSAMTSFDDCVGAVGLLGFQHGQWGVGEHPVVAVGRKQLALALRDRLGVEAFDPAHDQPGADVVGFTPGGKRGEGDLGDFGVGDQALFVFVPDDLVGSQRTVTFA
jgi:hypothetical protein